jgi:hypothetical protein
VNSAQSETLRGIFAKPTAKNISFASIVSLLLALDCDMIEGAGSRVRFVKGDSVLMFHRPHPGKEAKPYQVKDARNFLAALGISPGGEPKS